MEAVAALMALIEGRTDDGKVVAMWAAWANAAARPSVGDTNQAQRRHLPRGDRQPDLRRPPQLLGREVESLRPAGRTYAVCGQ